MRAQSVLICYTVREMDLHHALKSYPYVTQYIGSIALRRAERVERLSAIAHHNDRKALRHEILNQEPDEEDSQTEYFKNNHIRKRAKVRWQLAGRKTAMLSKGIFKAAANVESKVDENTATSPNPISASSSRKMPRRSIFQGNNSNRVASSEHGE